MLSGIVGFDPEAISRNFNWVLIAVTVGFFAWLFLSRRVDPRGTQAPGGDRRSLSAATVFWMAYEQAGSTLNLFAERNTNNVILGHGFPASWYQSLPPLFIIMLCAGVRSRVGPAGPSESLEPGQIHPRLVPAGTGVRRS